MTNPHSPRKSLSSQRVLAMLLGAMLAVFVVGIGLFIYLMQAAVPELTTDGFLGAIERWETNQSQNYNIETQVEGMQPAVYRVEVRDGGVSSATRNGNALRDPRTLGTWSVPGMFGTMERDVEVNAAAEPGQETLQLRAEFDPQYGYPSRYVRLAWGTKTTTSWKVVSFENLEDANATP